MQNQVGYKINKVSYKEFANQVKVPLMTIYRLNSKAECETELLELLFDYKYGKEGSKELRFRAYYITKFALLERHDLRGKNELLNDFEFSAKHFNISRIQSRFILDEIQRKIYGIYS